ncbi:hypothetical protein AD35_2717 [Escherichia coli 7-233-03_S4_C3]|nr:hypothetical protein AD35_2717 [Escherichia coli 7-233-03_S4_C3]
MAIVQAVQSISVPHLTVIPRQNTSNKALSLSPAYVIPLRPLR